MSSPAPEKKKKKWEINAADFATLLAHLSPDVATALYPAAAVDRTKTEERKEPPAEKLSSVKTKWELTQAAFDKFLGVLAADPMLAGEEYKRLRERLIFYFERKKCHRPEDLTDETFNRVCRKLDSGVELQKITNYCYRVARNVWLEYLDGTDLKTESLDERAFD